LRQTINVIGVLFIGIVGTIATLWAMGINIPFLTRTKPPEQPTWGIEIPVAGRAVPAYARISRDDLWDFKKQSPSATRVMPEIASHGNFLLTVDKIMGRVVKRDHPAGTAFREEDFYPPGTQAGMVAGVPPGKRALVLDASKIKGVYTLKAGDRFDLVATMPIDEKSLARGQGAGTSPSGVLAAQSGGLTKRAAVKVLVQNGAIVVPVTVRPLPADPNAADAKKSAPMVKNSQVPEVTLAVEPAEVVPLTEALAVGAEVTCIARSGRPEEPADAGRVESSDPLKGVGSMEVIVGGNRKTIVFPKAGGPPEEPDAPPK
jgi:Flp pilus assembly protein CpaB